jgi:hypothetical protein
LLGEQKGFDKDFLETYDFFQEYDDQIVIDFNYDQDRVPQCTDETPSD